VAAGSIQTNHFSKRAIARTSRAGAGKRKQFPPDGDDWRALPLSMRKANLARLLARRPDEIFISDFEQGEIGPDLFIAARRMGDVEATGSTLSERPIKTLDQDKEPEASCDRAGDGSTCLMVSRARNFRREAPRKFWRPRHGTVGVLHQNLLSISYYLSVSRSWSLTHRSHRCR